MGLESGTYINSLNPANPLSTDPKSQGDDHLRLVKSTVKNTFPNILGAVTPSEGELNHVDGVTAPIQGQIDTLTAEKADIAGETGYTGVQDFSEVTDMQVPAVAVGASDSDKPATVGFVNQTSLTTNLPAQTGNQGKFLQTDGTNAQWVTNDPVAAALVFGGC